MKPLVGMIAILALIFTVTGCTTTPAQEGAMWGGGIGAIAGQLIGGDTESTLIGAGAGALGGAILNDHMKNQENKAYQQGYNQGYNQGQATRGGSSYTPTVQQPQYNTAPR